MGGQKQTTKSQQSGTTNETATTTPNTFAPALGPVTNYYEGLGDIANQIKGDPYAFNPGQNGLQTAAYNNAWNLGGWQTPLNQSNNIASNVANSGPNFASGIGYTAPTLADAVTFGGASTGPAAQAAAQGYSIANLANAQGYNAPQLGPAAQAQAGSLLDNFSAYLNPATSALVDTTLADFDVNAGQARAAQQAAAARGGAFGGSRYGVGEAALAGELARGRATTDANVRFNAFNTAAGLSASDADRRTNTSQFNAGQTNNFKVAQGGFDAEAARFGADANNTFALNKFGAQNNANQFLANANNTNSMFNAGEKNQLAAVNANNANSAGIASMNAQNQRNSLEAELLAQMGMFNSSQFNDLSKFNAGQGDSALARQLSAAGLMSNNAGLMGQQQANDIATQMAAGNNLYGVQKDYMQSPLTNYGSLANLLGGGGLLGQLSGQTINSFGTSSSTGKGTQQTSGGFLGSLGGILGGLGGLAGGLGKMGVTLSDRRLKTDILRVGRTDGGLPVYTYRYKGEPAIYMGVMAQDVEQVQPGALGPEVGGYRTVNYQEVR